ncbi:sporulation integral membrane protein YtvI [Pseudalkalibacillus hwajinpoensis]|uniref:Sporulation integral membrane protein YtvI n=1 Tax=Guptibacillus hwajinpoensis TaxID=208199 RepID=A0A4U1MBE2_9BACL|nr:sporulation integral membrane protein YtvI [Pseudalkalibacillus hwajinpoensis]TKD67903.1 sporulation integral membrane protein YtvI [Pseudalkalibacillus hwajinpoensis]
MNWKYVHRFLRFLLVIAIIILTLIASYYIWHLAFPFVIALFLAFLINPMVDLLERRGKIPRPLSVALSILFLIGVLAAFIALLVNEIVQGIVYIANVLPGNFQEIVLFVEDLFVSHVMPLYNQLEDLFKDLNKDQQTTVIDNIQSIGTTVTATVTNILQSLVEGIRSLIVSLPTILTVLVFSMLATFFISKDWYKFINWVKKKVSTDVQKSIGTVYVDLRRALFGFLKAQLTLISMTAVIVLVGLIILRVDYAITIAIIIGFVDLLPYLGTGAIFVPWMIYSFLTGNYGLTIGLSILYGVVVIQRQVMEPKVLSSNIGLDPLATLIALFVGFQVLGFLGLIIGPVLLVVVKTLYHANVFKDVWRYIMG